jgi:hypothetical protein
MLHVRLDEHVKRVFRRRDGLSVIDRDASITDDKAAGRFVGCVQNEDGDRFARERVPDRQPVSNASRGQPSDEARCPISLRRCADELGVRLRDHAACGRCSP